MNGRTRWALGVVLGIALILRLVNAFARPMNDAALAALPDQVEYLSLGRNLLHHHVLGFVDPRFGQFVRAYRTPGYPMLVAASGGSARAVQVVQALLDTSTVLAVFLIARRWLTDGTALLAAGIIAVDPFLIFFSGLILSETLFIAMLIWALWLTLWRRTYLWGALLLALAVLVRPSAMLLPVFIGSIALFANRTEVHPYPRWWPLPPATTLLLLVLAVLAPWAYRNYLVLGAPILTTTNSGITLHDGFHDGATGASDQRDIAAMAFLKFETTEVQRNQIFSSQARLWIYEHPSECLSLAMAKIARTWSPAPLSDEYSRPAYRAAGLLFSLPLDLLALFGLVRGRLPLAAKALLVLPALYFTAVHAASVGSLRYRLPAEPPMAILAASALAVLIPRTSRADAPSLLTTDH